MASTGLQELLELAKTETMKIARLLKEDAPNALYVKLDKAQSQIVSQIEVRIV